jgi:hypothetical protein
MKPLHSISSSLEKIEKTRKPAKEKKLNRTSIVQSNRILSSSCWLGLN